MGAQQAPPAVKRHVLTQKTLAGEECRQETVCSNGFLLMGELRATAAETAIRFRTVDRPLDLRETELYS